MRRASALPRGALLAVLTLVAAGCVGPNPPASTNEELPLEAFDFTEALLLRHDHLDPLEHNFALGMDSAAWLQLVPHGENPGAHAVALHGERLYVKTNGAMTGFFILDVSAPLAPVVLGHYEDPTTRSGDRTIAVSGDGNTVFLGSEGERPGVHAIDVSDPANPRFVDYYRFAPYGAHSLFAHEAKGRQLVIAQSFGVQILEFRDTPLGMKLVPLSRFQTASEQILKSPDILGDGTTYAVRNLYGHDIFVETDTITGQTLLYVAFAYEGLRIADISDPERPVELARWVPADEYAPWYVHTVATTFIGERRIAVVGSEVFENRHVDVPSPLWILDVTDLSNPVHVATWTNPAQVGSSSLLMSAHNLRIEDGLIHVAHYHAGVFVIDIRAPEDPVVRGFILPAVDPGWRPRENCCLGFNMAAFPLVFDVEVKDGVTYAADWHTGLHVLRLTGASTAAEDAEV